LISLLHPPEHQTSTACKAGRTLSRLTHAASLSRPRCPNALQTTSASKILTKHAAKRTASQGPHSCCQLCPLLCKRSLRGDDQPWAQQRAPYRLSGMEPRREKAIAAAAGSARDPPRKQTRFTSQAHPDGVVVCHRVQDASENGQWSRTQPAALTKQQSHVDHASWNDVCPQIRCSMSRPKQGAPSCVHTSSDPLKHHSNTKGGTGG
jgi:hypothetical protein